MTPPGRSSAGTPRAASRHATSAGPSPAAASPRSATAWCTPVTAATRPGCSVSATACVLPTSPGVPVGTGTGGAAAQSGRLMAPAISLKLATGMKSGVAWVVVVVPMVVAVSTAVSVVATAAVTVALSVAAVAAVAMSATAMPPLGAVAATVVAPAVVPVPAVAMSTAVAAVAGAAARDAARPPPPFLGGMVSPLHVFARSVSRAICALVVYHQWRIIYAASSTLRTCAATPRVGAALAVVTC